ncbi:hypothetical protein [Sansalvadorimonas verongulae]|uniref:hypothetical protein n=1 Tax=Sansalvadorimonas verongulae TaxID=2172824 RepID=UPI0012BC4D75|nr:hypothetical protein [Sansalvadorimonas verongulae]MTI13949.1 hypothetical protein [Sansalvadorimonas verongulae]
MKSAVTSKPFFSVIILVGLLHLSQPSYSLSSGSNPPASFVPADLRLHENRKIRKPPADTLIPDEVIVSKIPSLSDEENLKGRVNKRKKKKKLSNLERLRQLYLLPLLQPLLSGGQ